jgi:hypothetical protein
MSYSVFTDRAIPYHLDGSVVKIIDLSVGVVKNLTASEMLELNDEDLVSISVDAAASLLVVFFPELRDVSAIFALETGTVSLGVIGLRPISALQGSADSTNGLDGTWVDATLPNGYPEVTSDFDGWRKGIKAITGLAGIKAIRFNLPQVVSGTPKLNILHLYGHKTAGQTPDDLIFLDAQNADAEFAIPLDFADRPAGTSAIRQIKVKNVSATLTANNITLESIDPVDDIRLADSEDGPWLTSKTITSLAPNTATAVIFVKCETDAPPTPLGPMRAPIKTSVGAWA